MPSTQAEFEEFLGEKLRAVTTTPLRGEVVVVQGRASRVSAPHASLF